MPESSGTTLSTNAQQSPTYLVGWDSLLLILFVMLDIGQFPDVFREGMKNEAFRRFLVEYPLLAPQNMMALAGPPLRWLFASFAMGLVCLYLVADFLERRGSIGTRVRDAAKRSIIFGEILLLVVFPLCTETWLRQSGTVPSQFDGLDSVELATGTLLNGLNPYATTYPKLAECDRNLWRLWGYDHNPAAEYVPYGPFLFLASAPFYAFFHSTLHWFDQRVVIGLAYLITLLVVQKLATHPRSRCILLIMFGLAPFLAGPMLRGYLESIVLLWLVLTVWALHRGRPALSAIPLAFAVTTKHYTAFLVPFYLLYIGRHQIDGLTWHTLKRTWLSVRRSALVFGLAVIAIVLPFALWDAHALYRSLFTYLDSHYPIKGANSFGIGSFLLYFGLVDSPRAAFPFWTIRILLGVPLLCALLAYQAKANTLRTMLECYFLFSLFFFVFTARAAHHNYIGHLVSVLALALVIQSPRQKEEDHEAQLA